MTGKILIIDNDQELTTQLKGYLALEGFEPHVANDGDTGLKLALNERFEAVILEVMMPSKNGFQVIQALRTHSQIPVLFLTARDAEVDKLIGLKLGGDEYLTKPCDPYDLLARLRALLRRSKQLNSRPKLEYGDIRVDCVKHEAYLQDKKLELTNTEFKILEILLKSPGQAFSKEELTEYALKRKFTAYDRSIDVHISNLRIKLGHNPQQQPWIKTVRGFGYLFNPIEAAELIEST